MALLTALVVGGLVSDDRKNGTSALYFSRPISRLDYASMKWLSAASVLATVILLTYMMYYSAAIVFKGEGWAFIADTIPIFLGGLVADSSCIHIHINRHSTLKHQHEQIHGFGIFPRIDSWVKGSCLAS